MKNKVTKLFTESNRFILLAALTLCFTLVFSITLQKVSEAAFARPEKVGFFTNLPHSPPPNATGLLTAWGGLQVDNIQALVDAINVHVHSGDTQESRSAAFIILTMMGYGAPGPNASNPRQAGIDVFPAWEAKVRQYNAAGLIDWNINAQYSVNTEYAPDINDVVWYFDLDKGNPKQAPSIIFWNAGRTTPLYQIKRSCGNPLENMSGLPDVKLPDQTVDGRIYLDNDDSHNFSPGDQYIQNGAPCTSGFASLAVSVNINGAGAYAPNQCNDRGGGVQTPFYSGTVCDGCNATVTLNLPSGYTVSEPNNPSGSYTFTNVKGHQTAWFGIKLATPPISGVKCGNVTFNPPQPEVNVGFEVKVNFYANIATSAPTVNYKIKLSMSGPGSVTIPVPNPASGSIAPGGTGDNHTWTGIKADKEGLYTGSYDISGDITLSCPFGAGVPATPDNPTPGPSIPVVTKPYFQVNGGDVAVGPTCQSPPPPNPWYNPSPPLDSLTAWASDDGTKGAGTNLAVFALKTIDHFASAQGSSPPTGLTFANQPTGGFGGNFGAAIACPADYYSKASGSASLPGNTVQNDVDSAYNLPGSITLNSGGPVNLTSGHRTVIYVNGNVYIKNNITLSSGATLDSLASFWLVVSGNIYIHPDVTQLDGVYVAQGSIYTCSKNDLFEAPTAGQLNGNDPTHTTCKKPLTVNGAFIAKGLKLYRSRGSMSDSATGAAEKFNYTPATWLVGPCAISSTCGSGNENQGYEAITSLPPVL